MKNRGVFVLVLSSIAVLFMFLIGFRLTGFAIYDSSLGNDIVYECGNITTAGVYTLNQSINATGFTYCLSVQADNVTINGNGSIMVGDGGINSTYGIYAVGRVNLTVKNFANISSFYDGIYFQDLNDSFIKNVSVSLSREEGIGISGSVNTILDYVSSNYNNGTGINLGSINSNLSNINTKNNFKDGLDLLMDVNSTIVNLTTSFNSEEGITLFFDYGTTFTKISSYNNSNGFVSIISVNISVFNSSFYENVMGGMLISSNAYMNLKNNNMSNNKIINFFLDNAEFSTNNSIDTSNVVDGDYIIYSNYSISNYIYDLNSAPNAGIVICSDCNNITIKDLDLSHKNFAGAAIMIGSNSSLINLTTNGNYFGAYILDVDNATIKNITATFSNYSGLYLNYVNNSLIQGNNLLNGSSWGIYLSNSHGNIFDSNNLNGNSESNFYFDNSYDNLFYRNNLIDYGKIFFYNYSISNYIYNSNSIAGAGEIVCAYCNNLQFENFNLSSSMFYSMLLVETNYSSIQNLSILGGKYGIYLENSNYINITNVNITNTTYSGILLSGSNYNYLSNLNFLTNNYGLDIEIGNYNNIISSVFSKNNNSIRINNSWYSNYTDIIINSSVFMGFFDISGGSNILKGLNFSNSGSSIDLQMEYAADHLIDINSANKYFFLDSIPILQEPAYGEIAFLDSVNMNVSGNFSSDIKILNNSVYVNASKSGLNVSANVTLYNLPSTYGYQTNQNIYLNGSECISSSVCKNLTTLRASSVIFNVTGWYNNYSYSIYRGTVDNDWPIVTQKAPTINIEDALIKFDVSDAGVIRSCTAYVSGVDFENTSYIKNTGNSISATDLDADTSYTSYINCTDEAGHTNKSATRTWVTDTNTGDPGTDGGGGTDTTAGFWTNTFNYYDLELAQKPPINRMLKKGERIGVKISGITHYIGIINIGSSGVTFNVSSTPQQATLKANQSKKFDIDGNGFYDLQVIINTINGTTNSNITVIYNNERVVAAAAGSNGVSNSGTTATNVSSSGSSGNGASNLTNGTNGVGANNTKSLIIFVLIIVSIIVAGIVAYLIIKYYSTKTKENANGSNEIVGVKMGSDFKIVVQKKDQEREKPK